jgi:hypothetical protein
MPQFSLSPLAISLSSLHMIRNISGAFKSTTHNQHVLKKVCVWYVILN